VAELICPIGLPLWQVAQTFGVPKYTPPAWQLAQVLHFPTLWCAPVSGKLGCIVSYNVHSAASAVFDIIIEPAVATAIGTINDDENIRTDIAKDVRSVLSLFTVAISYKVSAQRPRGSTIFIQNYLITNFN
jgi:hypothetical protein